MEIKDADIPHRRLKHNVWRRDGEVSLLSDVHDNAECLVNDGKYIRPSYEIDFVVNRGYERIYIQSAWMIPDAEKMAQETFSLKHTGDNFRKVVIDGSPMAIKHIDNDGIGHIGLLDFLLNPKSIETL